MPFDPLLKYAIAHESVSQRLIDICEMPKSSWSADAAYQYYLEFEYEAGKGSAFCMCMCGRFCRAGWGVPISGSKAMEWAEKASKSGYAPGHFEVGYCYEHGIGVTADLKVAQAYFVDSADAGYGYAATYLAAKFHDGSLGEKSLDKSIYYAELGYQLGDSTAPLIIAGWYENGDGVKRNEKNAVVWYKHASELGSFLATDRLRRAYEYGELGLAVDKDMAQTYMVRFESQIPE